MISKTTRTSLWLPMQLFRRINHAPPKSSTRVQNNEKVKFALSNKFHRYCDEWVWGEIRNSVNSTRNSMHRLFLFMNDSRHLFFNLMLNVMTFNGYTFYSWRVISRDRHLNIKPVFKQFWSCPDLQKQSRHPSPVCLVYVISHICHMPYAILSRIRTCWCDPIVNVSIILKIFW